MPLINPFTSETIAPNVETIFPQETYDRIQIYLNVVNWKCPNCGSIVFGRTLICPFNQNDSYCRTKRPE
jgi:predicted RNA-binding Zn-ribbon protein involved in translation (DUF1610 family)